MKLQHCVVGIGLLFLQSIMLIPTSFAEAITNISTVTETPLLLTDLSIMSSASSNIIEPGNKLILSDIVTNNGPHPVNLFTISHTIPKGFVLDFESTINANDETLRIILDEEKVDLEVSGPTLESGVARGVRVYFDSIQDAFPAGDIPKPLFVYQLSETYYYLDLSDPNQPLIFGDSDLTNNEGSLEVTVVTPLPATFIPITFNLPGKDIPAKVNPDSIQAFFNPNEYIITKKVSWENGLGSGEPATLEFTTGDPAKMHVELFFDGYEEGKSVKEYVDKIEKLALVNPEKHRPPVCLLTWGTGLQFKCVLESFNVRYTLFLDDGTPVRAVMNAVFKEFAPADKKLNSYTLSGDQLLELLDASQSSLPLLDSYGVESLQDVTGQVFANLPAEVSTSTIFPSRPPIDEIVVVAGSAYDPDAMQVTKGFKIEITGPSGGKEEDNSWHKVEGGTIQIEVTDTSVGQDQFHTTTPGHKYLDEINLKGFMTKTRKALVDWIEEKPQTECKQCKDVTLEFFDQNGEPLNQLQFQVIDAYFFKNEILLISIQDDKFHLTVLDIQRTRADGSQFSGPPRIFVVLPTGSPAFLPVAIAGTGFDQGTIPYINNVPSISLFNFGSQNIPLIGSISVGVTIVPPAAASGTGDVRVEYFGQMSNPFPFTVN